MPRLLVIYGLVIRISESCPLCIQKAVGAEGGPKHTPRMVRVVSRVTPVVIVGFQFGQYDDVFPFRYIVHMLFQLPPEVADR